MKISKESNVGVLAIVSMAILYLGFNYLKGSDFFTTANDYYVLYDNVDGLVISNQVMVNGLTVGRVKDIQLLQNQENKLLVTLNLSKKLAIPANSEATLADGGLLGGKLIVLKLGSSSKTAQDKDTLLARKEISLSEIIKEKAIPVIQNADSLLVSLRHISKQFQHTGLVLNKTLQTFDKTGSEVQNTVAENRAALKVLFSNVQQLTNNLIQTEKQISQQINPVFGKINTLADSLNALRLGQAVNNANRSLTEIQRILTGIQRGEGTIGKLTKDENLYKNMNRTVISLDRLLNDFRTTPKRYVHFSLFGKKESPFITIPDSTYQK